MRMNHSELLPAWWSQDNTSLLWQVLGRYGVDRQMLVRIRDNNIEWEINISEVIARNILSRTEAAESNEFLKAKKHMWGNGSAYPEKFTIVSEVNNSTKGPLIFPVLLHVYLTSNPKGIPNVPELDACMEANLDHEGNLEVTGFRLGKNSSWPF